MEREGPANAVKLERALTELRGVRGARVDLDDAEVKVVRVLVVPERHNSKTTEDVRRVAADLLGVSVDADRVQVLSAIDSTESETAGRRQLSSITIERAGEHFSARVTLELGGDVLVGESESPTIARLENRAVARAVLSGLHELLDFECEAESVDFLQVGGDEIVVVCLSREGTYLTGSAVIQLDHYETIARATLDALNRFLGSAAS